MAEFGVPIDADTEGKRSGELPDNLLAALGGTGENGDRATNGNEPQQALLAAQFLQVKAG